MHSVFLTIPIYRYSLMNIYLPFLGTWVHFRVHFQLHFTYFTTLHSSVYNENNGISDLRYSKSYDRLTFLLDLWLGPTLSIVESPVHRILLVANVVYLAICSASRVEGVDSQRAHYEPTYGSKKMPVFHSFSNSAGLQVVR